MGRSRGIVMRGEGGRGFSPAGRGPGVLCRGAPSSAGCGLLGRGARSSGWIPGVFEVASAEAGVGCEKAGPQVLVGRPGSGPQSRTHGLAVVSLCSGLSVLLWPCPPRAEPRPPGSATSASWMAVCGPRKEQGAWELASGDASGTPRLGPQPRHLQVHLSTDASVHPASHLETSTLSRKVCSAGINAQTHRPVQPLPSLPPPCDLTVGLAQSEPSGKTTY